MATKSIDIKHRQTLLGHHRGRQKRVPNGAPGGGSAGPLGLFD